MGLVVEAPSWPELCEEAARAFGGFVGGGAAEPASAVEAQPVTLTGADRDELWVRWWRALLRLWLVEERLAVGALDPTRCVDVKAVTWHGAHVERDGATWRGRIVLDV